MKLKIFSFLNKKGVYVLGFLCGVLLSLFMMFSVYAGEYIPQYGLTAICDWVGKDGISHTIFVDSNDSFLIAGFVAPNGSYAFRTNSDVMFCTTNLMNCDYYSGSDSPTKDSGVSPWEYSGTPVVYMPMFDTEKHRDMYLEGTLSNEEIKQYCLNYDYYVEMNTSYSFDESFPYFDRAVMELNNNDSVTYTSAMSDNMQSAFYDLCAKKISKDGEETDTDHYIPYIEFHAVALYANDSQLGIFNQAMMKSGSVADASVFDEIVQFDNNGKILASGYYGDSSYSGAGGRHSSSIIGIASTSPLMAVAVDDIGVQDKVSSFPKLVRTLSASSSINNNSTLGEILLGNGIASNNSYTLIGYAADVCINFYDVSTGNYVYSRDTYTYTWTFSALQQRYGSGTNSYNENGTMYGDTFQFDNQKVDTGSNWVQYDRDYVTNFVKQGFGLTGNDGYLILMGMLLTQIPSFIWVLIGMTISIYIGFLLFKLLVQFL